MRIGTLTLMLCLPVAAAFAGDDAKEEKETKPMDLKATIKTDRGDIVLELFPEDAPLTVMNFVNLAQRGYYDGLTFHRVINPFMIQGGDPDGRGSGGPGYKFEDEFSPKHKFSSEGVLAMANSGPRTNGSQFFITHKDTPHLNNKHTIFGKVVEGQDVVNAVKQGDKMNEIIIEGDPSELFKAHQDKLDEWNKILDKKYPKKEKAGKSADDE